MDAIEKPDTNYLIGIIHALLDDLIHSNGIQNTRRDKSTITRRVLAEGVEFLTKTLPLLAKALESALETGRFACPTNFGRYKSTALPAFMRGLLSRIFEEDGLLKRNPCTAAITELRQVSSLFYKMKMPFTTKQISAACQKFRQIDDSLPPIVEETMTSVTRTVLRLAREFLATLLKDFDPKPIRLVHGPGIVASGEKPHEKRVFSTIYRGIHECYPYYRYWFINPNHLVACVDSYRHKHRCEEGVNRVLFVPKDSRGPRTIACEPLEFQAVQGGLRELLYSHIENHPLTRGRINFSDQTVNQRLAELASIENWISTIDLKDASDSVSNDLVTYLFRDTVLLRYLQGTRSTISRLPDGTEVRLKKFAAMGSALCFPIEALVFYALTNSCYALREHTYPLTYVYGDDLIVDRDIYPIMNQVFSEVGLTINESKSFTKGSFRESCGKDYYYGEEVTSIKYRTWIGSLPDQIASNVEFSNLMFDRGYYKCAHFVEKLVKKLSFHKIPVGKENSSYLSFFTKRMVPSVFKAERWNKKLQRHERKVPYIKGKVYRSFGDTTDQQYGEMLRKFLNPSSEFVAGSYAVRHKIKIGLKYTHVGE